LIDIVASHDHTCAPFEPYVRTRLEWAMIDEARRVTRSRTLDVKADMLRQSGAHHLTTPSSRGPERIALNRARADAVRAALAFLDEELRTIVVRHHFEGQTLAQIGVALGRDKSWVSRLHARALEQLAALIRESGVVSARW
jgi:RNA polymerase sigma factor (sigma-70 family)